MVPAGSGRLRVGFAFYIHPEYRMDLKLKKIKKNTLGKFAVCGEHWRPFDSNFER